MTTNPPLIEFPCDFQIKIIGKKTDPFAAEITNIARKHYPTFNEALTRIQPSGQGNYLAITITVHALDKATLDALYKDITQHPDIKMVL